AFLAEAGLGPRDPLDGVDQRRKPGTGRETLEADTPDFRVRGNGDRGNVGNPIGERALLVSSDVDHVQRDLFRGAVPKSLCHLPGVLAGGAAEPCREDQPRRAGPGVNGKADRPAEGNLEAIFELLTNLLRDHTHTVIPDPPNAPANRFDSA